MLLCQEHKLFNKSVFGWGQLDKKDNLISCLSEFINIRHSGVVFDLTGKTSAPTLCSRRCKYARTALGDKAIVLFGRLRTGAKNNMLKEP